MIKGFKLEILICFSSPIIEHWMPLHQTPHIFTIPLLNWEIFIFAIPLSNWANFLALKALGELQMFFELQNKRNNVWRFNLNWVPQSLLTGLSTLVLSTMDTASAWSSIMASLNMLGSKLSYLFHSLLYISQGVQRFNVNNYLSISLCTLRDLPQAKNTRALSWGRDPPIFICSHKKESCSCVWMFLYSCVLEVWEHASTLSLRWPSPPLGELTCAGTSRST